MSDVMFWHSKKKMFEINLLKAEHFEYGVHVIVENEVLLIHFGINIYLWHMWQTVQHIIL